MAELTESGCVGFSQAEVPLQNTQVLQRALQYAATYGYSVWLRPQEYHLGKGVAASGPLATRLGLSGVPVAAVGGIVPWIIENGGVGCVFEPNPEALSRALGELLSRRLLRESTVAELRGGACFSLTIPGCVMARRVELRAEALRR